MAHDVDAGAVAPATVWVNGLPYELPDPAEGRLLGWLRATLGLTGAKPACGEGECGACTVLVDGTPEPACQLPLDTMGGHEVTTVEGLAAAGRLHPVQQALVDEDAVQCGYCIPGMAVRAAAVLGAHGPDTASMSDDELAAALRAQVCRCGCYPRIARAVRMAAAATTAPASDPPLPHAGTRSGDEGRVGVTALWPLPGGARPAVPWDRCAPEQREHLAVLGPGLVVVWPPPAAQGGWGADGGAWVHVGPSGTVRAFTGKVDVGQDPSTALRLWVAEELGTRIATVHLVAGDTDLCPYDAGTFGSRSMPGAGESLRRAAAGARAVLARAAARRWGVPTGAVTVHDGVAAGPGGRRVRIGELVGPGCELEVLTAEPDLRPAQHRVLVGRWGHLPTRVDVVTGRRLYVSDLARPGMAHAAVLRPPAPGATRTSLDTSGASALPAVQVVEAPPLVAALAPTTARAREAVAAMAAEWTAPPALPDDLVAHLRAHPVEGGDGWQRAVHEVDGDVDAALDGAAVSVRRTYTTDYIAHVPLETRAALAEWDGGRLTVWTGTQVPFAVRAQVASGIGIDESDVRVIVPPTGGAFGGKHATEVALEAAVLARAAGRPVLVHWSRTEEFVWGTLRPMAVIDVRAGLDNEGQLAAWEFTDLNAGPAALGLPYRAGARRLTYRPAASPLRQGSYRALAAPANNFARESCIDELSWLAGEDPVAFRLARLADERLVAVLRAAAERAGWAGPRPTGPPVRYDGHAGWGVAVGLEKGGRVATVAEVTVGSDRRLAVRRLVTAYECGTIVDPDTVSRQVEGGVIMALGAALFERVRVHDGHLTSRSLATYRVPRSTDVPVVQVVLCDRPDLPAAGAGETPMIAVAPAVANAVFAACGVRLRSLPLAPDGRVPAPD